MPLREAALYVGMHVKTLQRLDRESVLPAQRTATNRRYWLRADLDAFLGKTVAFPPKTVVVYCRVSSAAQRPDLVNQRKALEAFCTARGWAPEYVEEIGGGLNFKRPKLLAIIDQICAGRVSVLVAAHKDRVTRFGIDLVRHLCDQHNCELVLMNSESLSPEAEMVQDLMAITHCFSARLYGLRNYKRILKDTLK